MRSSTPILFEDTVTPGDGKFPYNLLNDQRNNTLYELGSPTCKKRSWDDLVVCQPIGVPYIESNEGNNNENIQKQEDQQQEQPKPSSPSTRKKKIVRRVRCKARGVEDKSHETNAFIEIPENCRHGTELTCSHPSCVKSGRKFRYCAECDVAVAKRNFIQRHGHGLLMSLPVGKFEFVLQKQPTTTTTTTPILSSSSLENNLHDKNQTTTTSAEPVLAPSSPLSNINATIQPVSGASLPSHIGQVLSVEGGRVSILMATNQQEKPQQDEDSTESKNQRQQQQQQYAHTDNDEQPLRLSGREKQWLKLFHNRPSSSDFVHITEWIEQLMDLAPESPSEASSGRPNKKARTLSPLDMDAAQEQFCLA